MIVLLGHCSCCGQAVPGIDTGHRHPGRVQLDYHLTSQRDAFCIGSRSVMRRAGDQ